jgi:hypothetical protein
MSIPPNRKNIDSGKKKAREDLTNSRRIIKMERILLIKGRKKEMKRDGRIKYLQHRPKVVGLEAL